MMIRPPGAAARLLRFALRRDPAGPAILGDLHEDFVRISRTWGPWAARFWYWQETLRLLAANVSHGTVQLVMGGLRMVGPTPLRGLALDMAHAARSVLRVPVFSIFTAAVIALGVGASTGVFSILKPLFLAPLPVHEPESLVWIANQEVTGTASLSRITSRSGNLRDLRERARSFEGLTGYNAFSQQTAYTLTGVGHPERLVGYAVAHDFLEVLGIQPVHGRSFTLEEGRWGGPPAVILSYAFWRSHFPGDPGIVGEALDLNGVPHSVVGVLPSTFDFSSMFTPGIRVDFLIPYPVSDETDRHGNEVIMVGRLGSGVTPEAAQAEVDAVLAGLQEEQPDRWGLDAHLTPLQEHLAGPFRPAFFLLIAAAGILVLIVCVNVSSLLLTRLPQRSREIALKKTLGASRGRLGKQMVLESLGVSLAGAAMGAGLAWVAVTIVAGAAGIRVPLLDTVHLDASALLVGTGVALLTGFLVSLMPALQVTEGNEAAALREAGRGSSGGRRAQRLREGLVVAEVTLAFALLVAGGLLTRSFRAVLNVDMGFEPAGVVAWQLNPSLSFNSRTEESLFYASVVERVAQLPGVQDVGLIDALPLGRTRTWPLRVPERPQEDDRAIGFFPHMVDPGYLGTMGISLLAGRNVSWDDTRETPLVVLVNETGAERLFPGEAAVGRQVRFESGDVGEIVGVVADVRHVSPEMGSGTQVYFPMTQVADYSTLDMVVRSSLPADRIVPAVVSALGEMDPNMPGLEFWTVQSVVDRAVSARRFTLGILTAYGIAALLLAGLGIYGVLAQTVAERTSEIGIRMALGASAQKVVWGVMGRTLLLAAVGIVVGIGLSLWATRLVAAVLFGVEATDPLTFAGMALLLFTVSALAGFLPAVRAARTRAQLALQAQ